MTTKIIDAYLKKKPQFEELHKIFQEIKELNTKEDETIRRIIRYYNIIFKNISPRRKIIHLKGIKDAFVVTKAGLGKKQDWQTNSVYLTSISKVDFLNYLVLISKPEHKKEFKKVLLREKYKIFDNFLRKAKWLEIQKTFNIHLKKNLKSYLGNTLLLSSINLNYSTFELTIDNWVPAKITISVLPIASFQNMEHISILEQILPQAKRLLLTAKKTRQKEIDNMLKFIEYLRTKFENQIVLEELYSKPRSDILK